VSDVTLGAPGLFGKIPAQPDFVRLHGGEPLVQALALFLEEAVETSRGAVAAEGPPVRFLLRFPLTRGALVGAIAPSTDRVGRRFPLAVFATIAGPGLALRFPLLPIALRGFLAAAEEVLAASRGLPLAEVQDRVRALGPQAAADLAASEPFAAAASGAPARGLLDLLGEGGAQAPYAMHAFRTACQPVRGREPAKGGVALDCPVADDAHVHAWLELTRRHLAWPEPPSFLWREGAAPRLLVALGPPPAAAAGRLLGATADHPKIWPLTTRQPDAVAAACRALGPELTAALERPGATLGDLVSSFSR
jgi:type VI secretion system protein ImpM